MRIARILGCCVLALAILALPLAPTCAARALGPAGEPDISIDSAPVGDALCVFLANRGQYSPEVSFCARGLDGSTFLTRKGELVYVVADNIQGGLALRESLLGARGMLQRGRVGAEAVFSSFRDADPDGWAGRVPAWTSLSCGEIYEGIELDLAIKQGRVEKIFRVAPGADASAIRLRLEGADKLSLAPDGRLLVSSAAGELSFSAPVAWQEHDSESRPVEVSYILEGLEYGFALGDHDPGRELCIDPLLAGTFLGGISQERSLCAALDAEGNVYIAGYTWSTDLPAEPGSIQPESAGSRDVFIARFNSDLSQLLACSYLGGGAQEEARGLAVAANGDIYMAGNGFSNDFPTTTGAYQESSNGGAATVPYECGGEIFISRLSADLDLLVASTYLGGSQADWCRDVQLDGEGNVFVCGFTRSSDFPCPNGFDPVYHPGGNFNMNGCVAKLDADLSTLLAGSYLGGSLNDYIESMALDADGCVHMTGWIASLDFPVTPGAFQQTHGGALAYYDAFLSKFSNDLGSLEASTYCGGVSWDFAYAVVVDGSGHAYITGHTASNHLSFPISGDAWDGSYNGAGGAGLGDDVFVTKIEGDAYGQVLASTFLGSTNWENGWALALDETAGAIYVGGSSNSSNFPVAPDAWDTEWGGGSQYSGDGFVCSFDLDLTTRIGCTFVGDSADETVEFLLACEEGVYVTGFTGSPGFPMHQDACFAEHAGSTDAYLILLDPLLGAEATAVEPVNGEVAPGSDARILGNWPNPFNPRTDIAFSLEQTSRARLGVYSVTGELLRVLADRAFAAGTHELSWDGRDDLGHELASGAYLLSLETGSGGGDARKLILLR